MPSISEGFSVTLLEALASCLPVIVTEACNFPEIKREECGFTAKPGPNSLHDAIEALLILDDFERRRMGANSRRIVDERYSWEHIAKQMIQLYRWCLGDSSSSLEIYD